MAWSKYARAVRWSWRWDASQTSCPISVAEAISTAWSSLSVRPVGARSARNATWPRACPVSAMSEVDGT